MNLPTDKEKTLGGPKMFRCS